jgi:hypothetical protein
MKKTQRQSDYATILLLCAMLWTITSCQSHKSILANKDICYYDTVITSQEMFFDATKYDSQFLKVRLTIPSTRDYFDKNTVSRPYRDRRILNWQTNSITPVKKYIKYTPDGKIMGVNFYYRYAPIGRSFRFDENGAITEIIDHDKGYKVCWAQAIEIAKKLDKRLLSRDSVVYVHLFREEWNNTSTFKPQWGVSIQILDKRPPNHIKRNTYYGIDGITGKLIESFKLPLVNDDLDIRPR